MAKHTPGPWITSLADDTTIIGASGETVAKVSGDYNDDVMWPTMEANARLIAAAPEMLELLSSLLTCYGSRHKIGYWKDTRELLAKIEGAP